MRLMPGMSKEMRQAAGQIDDGEVAKVEAIVCSMTPAERDDVNLLDGSRRSRIARGSGTSIQDVNTLLKQFKEMQKMMKGMVSGNLPNLPGMPQMGGRAARKLAQHAAGAGAGGPDFDMLSQLMGDSGQLPASFPGLPAASAQPVRPVVSANKGTKKKKKGGRVTPPKGR
jgi:hypothetical protein